jgi:nucleoside diphosphate kinase
MAKELSFVLINPYTIRKSRTGGIISRVMARTGLELVSARMFGPSAELTEQYAQLLEQSPDLSPEERQIFADYVRRHYAPDARTGRPHRVLLLLLEGEDAIAKVRQAVGPLRSAAGSGETVRETFGDFVTDTAGQLTYCEPAVMTARSAYQVGAVLRLWAAHSARDGGIVQGASDVSSNEDVQTTLVILKPDNFRFPSARVGNIIDIFSASGLRIIAAKMHRMSVAQAEEFYGPVRDVLRRKLTGMAGERGSKAITQELGLPVPADVAAKIGDLVGPLFGDHQFFTIIQFMTGQWAPEVPEADKATPGLERCLILVYRGSKAVEKIRKILGPTDPSKAEPGSVRKEYGKDIMVNAAHASDSPENAQREMRIVKVDEDLISATVKQYYS